jgi:hypothetical protein
LPRFLSIAVFATGSVAPDGLGIGVGILFRIVGRSDE